MPTIVQLSPTVVNKIAAGEVIERPASVVKELMENAVDAGATRIDVSLEKGGSELIRVADDGCGISAEELPLAVASHATSKIRAAEDLFSVGTLGFRGEALASIAAVSRLTIRSREHSTPEGAELEIVGGVAQPVVPVGCRPGTTMEVRNLFFNTPVRHKFLRTTQTETGHATEAFTRIALAHPEIHFTLTNNNRVAHDLPATSDIRDRIATFFGEEIAEGLIEVESENEGVRLSGYVVNPMQNRANNRMQYLFLNGRAIRDRSLQHALAEAYRGLILTGRHPICFLRMNMPPELVDVNVHPTKQEVRFADAGRLYSQLLGTLRTKFLTSDLTARVQSDPRDILPSSAGESAEGSGVSQLVAWAKERLEQNSGAQTPSTFGGSNPAAPGPLSLHRLDRPEFSARPSVPTDADDREERDPADISTEAASSHRHAVQIHNRYLVTETADGLEIIDQHALHERILFERMKAKIAAEALESQKLLVPEPVDLTASEAATLLQHAEILGRLGLQVEPFGGETVLVSSYPAMLANIQPAEVLRDLAEQLESSGKEIAPADLLEELLHSFACKAAVKFGDPLEPDEIATLLADRHMIQDQHHCPHGRPTTLFFSRAELDRQFKRI